MKKIWIINFCIAFMMTGCAEKLYYAGMEKVGVHKRDIMVDRVENVQETQKEAQEEFQSALEQFGSLVNIQESELQKAYEKFNSKFEDAQSIANELSERIDKLESVSIALFEEWEEELQLYTNQNLKDQSKKKLQATQGSYSKMLKAMRTSEKSMEPILATFQDNVLMLKHSLNAQAIGALKGEFQSLQKEIQVLISQMNQSIEESNQFIQQMN